MPSFIGALISSLHEQGPGRVVPARLVVTEELVHLIRALQPFMGTAQCRDGLHELCGQEFDSAVGPDHPRSRNPGLLPEIILWTKNLVIRTRMLFEMEHGSYLGERARAFESILVIVVEQLQGESFEEETYLDTVRSNLRDLGRVHLPTWTREYRDQIRMVCFELWIYGIYPDVLGLLEEVDTQISEIEISDVNIGFGLDGHERGRDGPQSLPKRLDDFETPPQSSNGPQLTLEEEFFERERAP